MSVPMFHFWNELCVPLFQSKTIPVIIITMLIHCEVDKLKYIPLIKSPLKNSNVNLVTPYNTQYKPIVLYVPKNLLYVTSKIRNIIKLQIDSTICIGNSGTPFGASNEL